MSRTGSCFPAIPRIDRRTSLVRGAGSVTLCARHASRPRRSRGRWRHLGSGHAAHGHLCRESRFLWLSRDVVSFGRDVAASAERPAASLPLGNDPSNSRGSSLARNNCSPIPLVADVDIIPLGQRGQRTAGRGRAAAARDGRIGCGQLRDRPIRIAMPAAAPVTDRPTAGPATGPGTATRPPGPPGRRSSPADRAG